MSIALNLIYVNQQEPPTLVFENDIGKVWMSNSYNGNMANIAMNSYSAVKINQNDSILLVEPMCILDRNYDVNFLEQFRFIFAWSTKALQHSKISNKVVYVNLPSHKGNPKIDASSWLPWTERSNEIVFIANNKTSQHLTELYSLRVRLADWLYVNSRFKVSWYGNIPLPKPYYRGKVNNKADVLRKVKFSVCMENSYDPVHSYNYLSEKMPDVWLSGAIPIYMGCANLDELGISKDCFVDLLPLRSDFHQLEKILSAFSEEDYQRMTKSYCALSDELYRLTSYENMFDKMLKVYSQ